MGTKQSKQDNIVIAQSGGSSNDLTTMKADIVLGLVITLIAALSLYIAHRLIRKKMERFIFRQATRAQIPNTSENARIEHHIV